MSHTLTDTAPGNPYSHLCARSSPRLSYPYRILLARNALRGRILDFGCGLGEDVARLKEKGFDISGYDSHFASALPKGLFDTIVCQFVLDVLLPEQQADALVAISRLLKPTGKAFIAVKRGTKQAGFRLHKATRLPVYQSVVSLPYASCFQSRSCEIYEYWPYTWLHKGNAAASPFLAGDMLCTLLGENTLAFAIHPPGVAQEIMVLPKRREADYFALTKEEQAACWHLVHYLHREWHKQERNDGFAIHINTPAAGTRSGHAHIILQVKGMVRPAAS